MLFASLGAAVIAVVLAGAVMSLFLPRHGESAHPESGWVATDEVFKDPVTERLMRVWTDPSGQRHYLPEAGQREESAP
ncbi:MAG TPA: hypothetical protein VN768_02830 [Acidimicrobiales bacterium]|nr:hypothetical protein [Acidimicrobiales bacterium]